MPVQKRIIVYIAIAVVAVAIASSIIILWNDDNTPSPTELLSLGEKYLSELDYEQALVQFLKVIEIEPMNERAYLGAAEAYIGLGQTDEAIAILEQGIAETDSEEIRARFLELIGVEDSTEPTEESQPTEESTSSASESDDFMPANIAELFEQVAVAFQQENYDVVTQLAYNTALVEFLRANPGAKYSNVIGEAFGNVDPCILGYVNVDASGNGYGICFHADNGVEYGGSYLESFDISAWSATGKYESGYYGSTSSFTIYETGNIVDGFYEGEVQWNNSDGTSWSDPYLRGINVNPDSEGVGVGFDPDLPAPYVNIEFMLPINNPNWNIAN